MFCWPKDISFAPCSFLWFWNPTSINGIWVISVNQGGSLLLTQLLLVTIPLLTCWPQRVISLCQETNARTQSFVKTDCCRMLQTKRAWWTHQSSFELKKCDYPSFVMRDFCCLVIWPENICRLYSNGNVKVHPPFSLFIWELSETFFILPTKWRRPFLVGQFNCCSGISLLSCCRK